MMKKLFHLFICLILLILGMQTQAQEIIVKGVIFEKGTNNRIALAEIQNSRTKQGVGSNDLGMFNIRAMLGDTLYFYKSNLVDQQIVVRDQKDLIVYLVRAINQLDDVTVRSQSKKEDFDELRNAYRAKGVYNNGKTPILSYFFSPLNAIYNLFGKEPKNARRFNRYATNELNQTKIDQYFNPSIIRNNTSLTGDELEKYMLDWRPSYDKAQFWNSYDYIKYIKDSSKQFLDTLGKSK